jgi:hypothetical protein
MRADKQEGGSSSNDEEMRVGFFYFILVQFTAP